jgi:hypothetical protein
VPILWPGTQGPARCRASKSTRVWYATNTRMWRRSSGPLPSNNKPRSPLLARRGVKVSTPSLYHRHAPAQGRTLCKPCTLSPWRTPRRACESRPCEFTSGLTANPRRVAVHLIRAPRPSPAPDHTGRGFPFPKLASARPLLYGGEWLETLPQISIVAAPNPNAFGLASVSSTTAAGSGSGG